MDHKVDKCDEWGKPHKMAQYFSSANKGLGFYHVDVAQRKDRVNYWYTFENCGVITLEEGEIEQDELIRNLQ